MPKRCVRKGPLEFCGIPGGLSCCRAVRTAQRAAHLRGNRDFFQGTCPWKKYWNWGARLRAAGVTRGRFFSPIFARLRCDKRTVPAVPPPQKTGSSPEKGGTEGRFFCHTAGGTKEPSLCNAGRKLPVAVKGVVSVNPPPTPTGSVPRARRTTGWLIIPIRPENPRAAPRGFLQ